MTIDPKIALRLQFMARVVRKECQHWVPTGTCLARHSRREKPGNLSLIATISRP